MRNMAVKCLGSHLVHVSRTSLLYNVHHAMKKFNTHTREREREREREIHQVRQYVRFVVDTL